MVRWFWGLTSDFWAENAKNKCKTQKRQQIPVRLCSGQALPCDNKKSKGKDRFASLGLCFKAKRLLEKIFVPAGDIPSAAKAQRSNSRVMVRRPKAKEDDDVSREVKNVPQQLKPRLERSVKGTAEAVPLSKTEFSASSKALGSHPRPFRTTTFSAVSLTRCAVSAGERRFLHFTAATKHAMNSISRDGLFRG
jgi:hypothetical protein